jgi:F0F1-type ATP synthase assembly protein I
MPVLSNINAQILCGSNQALLRNQGLVDLNGLINLNRLNPEDQKNLVSQLIENEKSNAEGREEIYQKAKYKADHIMTLLISALALLGVGFTLAPLFIVSPLILPVLPVLLFGVAIVAITKFFLNIKINQLETNVKQTTNASNQLKESKEEMAGNLEEGIIRTVNHGIQEIKIATAVVSEKNDQNFSNLLDIFGKFRPVTTPIPSHEPALETVSSPTHS